MKNQKNEKWFEQHVNYLNAQLSNELIPSTEYLLLSSPHSISIPDPTATTLAAEYLSSTIKVSVDETNDEEDSENDTVIEETQPTTEEAQYQSATPDPLTIRDGWDSDVFMVLFGEKAIVLSTPRDLGLFAPNVAHLEHYTEVRPQTQPEGPSCDCKLSGLWSLYITHLNFNGDEGGGLVEGTIFNWSIDFGNGQIFSSEGQDEEFVLAWETSLFFFEQIYLDVSEICIDANTSIKVTIDMDILGNESDFSLTLISPTGHSIKLFDDNLDDIGFNGTYMFSDEAEINIDDADTELDNTSSEVFVPGNYQPTDQFDPEPEEGFWTTFEDLLDHVCEEVDFSSGSNEPTFPIILDLDGDGLELNALEDSDVLFDVDNDGALENTAWFGPDEGMLVFDLLNDGQITNVNEFAFANWHPEAQTDLDGLRLALDTNQDGTLNAQDDSWEHLAIWQDSNQNGISDEGEYLSLESLDIIEIELSSDGNLHINNGNTVNGFINVIQGNGEVLKAGDVALAQTDVPQPLVVQPAIDANNELAETAVMNDSII